MEGEKTALLIIDPQVDFHEGGSLAVAGATDDSTRLADLINSRGDQIDQIYVTLDSHHRLHIAHAVFWKNAYGESPPPFTIITNEDVKNEVWIPVNEQLKDHCLNYTEQLEKGGRLKHCIWPEHCLIGTPGHAVVPQLNDALQNWSLQKGKTINYVHKGQNCMTEMYSALKADVVMPDDPATGLNIPLINELKGFDHILVGGEARSHCVNYTVRDLVSQFSPEEMKKVVILEDGCSSVAGFEEQGSKFFEDMQQLGCFVKTTTDFDEVSIS
eukprot:CAMPEP_0117750570 /NCGR_PEP_ID=MMETSP0947-20121206/10450_1 /TAXON_ID=44440 /ORGANISM="Chattonella subsalsa, Strain CCMP2191" /LENGTH=270 /DNA_ID=CAMNT_0005568769 /DNA_START=436 /DNA_END=1248 /DNA_ORIENTATION=-